MSLHLQPITQREADSFIRRHHRHHGPARGWKLGMAVNDGATVVGVITIGRPIARMLDDGYTAEVTRCCTDGTKHAASKLYAAAWRETNRRYLERADQHIAAGEGIAASLALAAYVRQEMLRLRTERIDGPGWVDRPDAPEHPGVWDRYLASLDRPSRPPPVAPSRFPVRVPETPAERAARAERTIALIDRYAEVPMSAERRAEIRRVCGVEEAAG